jgi:hypothetical protein
MRPSLSLGSVPVKSRYTVSAKEYLPIKSSIRYPLIKILLGSTFDIDVRQNVDIVLPPIMKNSEKYFFHLNRFNFGAI